jgi:hypothetical protein
MSDFRARLYESARDAMERLEGGCFLGKPVVKVWFGKRSFNDLEDVHAARGAFPGIIFELVYFGDQPT